MVGSSAKDRASWPDCCPLSSPSRPYFTAPRCRSAFVDHLLSVALLPLSCPARRTPSRPCTTPRLMQRPTEAHTVSALTLLLLVLLSVYHIVTNILTLFLVGDLSADSRKDSSHESAAPTLLQQDQRQHRLAARRQATAQSGTVHATSKIKTSAGVSTIAQPLTGEVFGAAPQPAVAKQTHAVFKDKPNPEQRPSPLTTPPDLPSPAHLGSTKGKSLPADGKQSTAHSNPSDSAAKSNPPHRAETKPESTEKQPTPQSSLTKSSTSPQPQQPTPAPASAPRSQASSPSPSPMPSGWIEVHTVVAPCYYIFCISNSEMYMYA